MEKKFVLDWSVLGEVFNDDHAKCSFLEVVTQTLDDELSSVKLGVERGQFEVFGAFRHSFSPLLQQLGLFELEKELTIVQPDEQWEGAARMALANMSSFSVHLERFIAELK